jgi:ABC-type multidrug transport system ATPase subunit
MSEPLIVAEGVTKEFAGLAALREISFALPEGSRTALVGGNGAGKTTLLEILGRLAGATRGRARVGPSDADEVERRAMVGYLGDRPMLYEELTPLENLQFFQQLYGPSNEDRIEELLRAVGLWSRRYSATSTLSRGFHQRLGMARALVHAPRVLLLDEPETGLDVAGVELLDTIMLTAPGVTVLASTHRLDRIERWSDGVLRLEAGRLVEDTATAAVETAANVEGAR